MDLYEDIGLHSTLIEPPSNMIFTSAVQITRPKSATKQGSSSLTNSPINQFKVAKLVLKPAQPSISNKTINKPSSPSKNTVDTRSVLESLRSNQNNKVNLDDHKPLMKKYQANVELEMKTRKAEKEKKALNAPAAEITVHKSTTIDEATRSQAREYMKKQREKRKLETKKEVDKTFVIKQRLDELRKTTRNVIVKKPKPKKNAIKISPPNEYYSMNNANMKEIKVLRLKPMPVKKSPEKEVALEESGMKPQEVSLNFLESSPEKQPSPVKKPASPVKKPAKKPTRPSSAKENQKPRDENLKLKVPDVKLSMSAINRTEIGIQSYQVPYWLQDTAIQPYPYNFIWAVRKKLEAYTSSDAEKKVAHQKTQALMNFATPHIKKTRVKKSREFGIHHGDDTKHELQRPTIADDSETTVTSLEIASEANTISEISSIKSDMALVKSHEKQQNTDDDTTISESIFHSLKDDAFVGKKRESINSEFDRASFDKKVELKLAPENVSPNTSEKRDNFLVINKQNDLDNNKINQEKEEEYQKMLQAFNQSLSHVIEVNQMLSTVLTSKSSSVTSGTVKNYSSSFENNVESEAHKSSDISEMIENLLQKSKPAAALVEAPSDSNSSIPTFIEDSKSTTLKPENDKTIEDPPITYVEPQEFSSSTTKVTTSIEIVQQNDEKDALNESNLMNVFRQSEAENSFNITFADNNTSFGILMDKSSTEIKSWERTLIERTRGQIAWLELQKQNFRKHGQVEKVSTIKKQQRAILLRLEKERGKLRENSEKSSGNIEENMENSIAIYEKSMDLTANESDARQHIERILIEREHKINKRRAQVDHLVKWQRKLDKEEEKLKQMEQELLGDNMKKLSSPRRKKKFDDVLNTSIEMVKSIDKSLKILHTIEPSNGEELLDVTGAKLNKLWYRLTGDADAKYAANMTYHLTKEDFSAFYEDAKEFVLQSDLKALLETSLLKEQRQVNVVTELDIVTSPEKIKPKENLSQTSDDEVSNVSTMNSIANIETEEEFLGSYPETFNPSTENDDELQEILANQMKVFIDQRKPPVVIEQSPKLVATTPTIDNATFQVHLKTPEDSNSNASSDMDIEQDSLIQTEPLVSIDNSAVDADGSIIPEINEPQVTDMDDENESNLLIEDISFPDFDVSIIDETAQLNDSGGRNDLSTITECTEYEQSQGSCSDDISSEVVSHASTATTSERVNSEIEKRLISINESLEEVNLAFKKAITNRSPSTVTYSTDKDFVNTPKPSSSPESNEKSDPLNLLSFSLTESESTGSHVTTSTPKVLMPDIISEVSGEKKEESNDF